MAYGKLSPSQMQEIDYKLLKLKNKMIKESGFVFKAPKQNMTPLKLGREVDRQLRIFDKELARNISKEKNKLRKKLTRQFQQKNGDKLKESKVKKKRSKNY